LLLNLERTKKETRFFKKRTIGKSPVFLIVGAFYVNEHYPSFIPMNIAKLLPIWNPNGFPFIDNNNINNKKGS